MLCRSTASVDQNKSMNCITFFRCEMKGKVRPMGTSQTVKGFTLIELMIVVAIVAILAMIGYPAYNDQVRKTARKAAIGVVLDSAGRLERIRSQKFKYDDTVSGVLLPAKRYNLTLDAPDPGTSYTITATPTGDQVDDACGVMTYTNVGVWTFTKNAASIPENDCL